MNESTVTFWQVMMVLQILLMAKLVRFDAGMKMMFKRMRDFLCRQVRCKQNRKYLPGMLKPVKGEKI